MNIQGYFIFNFKRSIAISILPILDIGFENCYEKYKISIELGWLCFGVLFEFTLNKK